MLQVTASDVHTYYRPSQCALRLYLRHHGEPEGKSDPYDELLMRMGLRHERSHLETLPMPVDLSVGSRELRVARTKEAIKEHAPVVYHGVLVSTAELHGIQCEVVGEPDFLIKEKDDAYRIVDSKISRRINGKEHPEILSQLQLYGWLYETTFGKPPSALHVHSGTGDIIDIPYEGEIAALEILEEIAAIKQLSSEPYSPVGWSKCSQCRFFDRCWPLAEQRQDVAIVPDVNVALAGALRDEGVKTIEDLITQFDEERLSEFKILVGAQSKRVGKKAATILKAAQAISSGKEELVQPPDIPQYASYAMFDLEGIPPQLEKEDRIYLWGIQVFGDRAGVYRGAVAGFGEDGDRQGWEDFLGHASAVLEEYGDLPFVHWSDYERTNVRKYVERYGDPQGIAKRVQDNLLDLHSVTKKSIVLPLPSYSLKVVEGYIGFKRSQDEYGGKWAMAKYAEAMETENEQAREKLMEQILTYNQEDLKATWAILNWLKGKCK